MNGIEHYKAAESLLSYVTRAQQSTDIAAVSVAAAQVHATLALAEATALARSSANLLAWQAVARVTPPL
jgi:hypothetical protein